MPCPSAGQGICPYRRSYCCADAIRDYSSGRLGHCAIEAYRYRIAVLRGLEEVGRASWAEATPDEQAKIASWAEARVYLYRAVAYGVMRVAGEVSTPSHENVLRYQAAALNIESARWEALVGPEDYEAA